MSLVEDMVGLSKNMPVHKIVFVSEVELKENTARKKREI